MPQGSSQLYSHVLFKGVMPPAQPDRWLRPLRQAPSPSIFASAFRPHAPVISPTDRLLLEDIFRRAQMNGAAYRPTALARRVPACLRALQARSPAEALRKLEVDPGALEVALNALLIQSSGPLFVALWSLILFGVRLTWAQTIGIVISLSGVLVIILRGDVAALAAIEFNLGDIMFAAALAVFGLYSAVMPRRPKTHPLSLIAFTTGWGALMLLPLVGWEIGNGQILKFDALTIATLVFVVIFPSTLAYIFFNRSIELIGPNRAAPFFHLVPVFGSAMAIGFLGEQLRLFHLIGYALVLAGVVIASRKPGRA